MLSASWSDSGKRIFDLLLMNKNICIMFWFLILSLTPSCFGSFFESMLKLLRQIYECNVFIEHIELSLGTYMLFIANVQSVYAMHFRQIDDTLQTVCFFSSWLPRLIFVRYFAKTRCSISFLLCECVCFPYICLTFNWLKLNLMWYGRREQRNIG